MSKIRAFDENNARVGSWYIYRAVRIYMQQLYLCSKTQLNRILTLLAEQILISKTIITTLKSIPNVTYSTQVNIVISML